LKSKSRSRSKTPENKTLHVKNISRNTNEEHLKEIFQCFGAVEKATVVVDSKVGLSLGFAYMDFASRADAEAAMKAMDGGQIDGNRIVVTFKAMPVKQREVRSSGATIGRGRERERERERERQRERRRAADRRRSSPPSSRRYGGGGSFRGGYRSYGSYRSNKRSFV